MKTIFAAIGIISILAVGTLVFANGTGGKMMGQHYGKHMMAQNDGGNMMGYGRGGGPMAEVDQEFLDKTVDLRKALHDKKFEYREAARNPETINKELIKIKNEMFDIRTKIQEIAPRSATYSESAPCWER